MKINKTRILVALAEKGLSKADVARRSGYSRQTVCNIISRGTCEPKTLGRLAAALEMDVEQLMEKEG